MSFSTLPYLNAAREKVKTLIPDNFVPQAEGNLYYDTSKTYIGFHGDTERTFVIGLRLGDQIPLHFQWYQNSEKIGPVTTIEMNHGDVYIMSCKAVGSDWKKRKIPTLRHAAGNPKLIKGML